ncbi:hypothetical protein E2493_14885 [Sphingomonas parva]|uniref:Uncharacterized protein n=1 Tax=Sphingomonas parva TaxID=2555898 RepID=A0A4Y8ZNA5_9SPHN|nr:hypothetical protein [Sphingomonas parva]TFI57490.1 hypothetical protein E2493_14885 [Sphingomonas parva]
MPFSLYREGNHPSLAGSYAAALVVYACLSKGDVDAVRWVPRGLGGEHAALLRARVGQSLRARHMAGAAA